MWQGYSAIGLFYHLSILQTLRAVYMLMRRCYTHHRRMEDILSLWHPLPRPEGSFRNPTNIDQLQILNRFRYVHLSNCVIFVENIRLSTSFNFSETWKALTHKLTLKMGRFDRSPRLHLPRKPRAHVLFRRIKKCYSYTTITDKFSKDFKKLNILWAKLPYLYKKV